MKVTALQLPARWNEVERQLQYVETLLEAGPKTDLVLLPEASVTGYVSPARDFDLTRFAESLDGPTRAAYAHFAKRFDCLMVGPLIERDGEQCFNSLIGVTPSGETLIHYRKHHPWFPEAWATAGEKWCDVVEWRGVRVTAAICFDIHFLLEETVRADLILFSSAWVDDDDVDARTPLLQALAVKNQLAVLNANWGPGDVRVRGQGGLMFVNAAGAVTQTEGAQLSLSMRQRGEGWGEGATDK